MGAWMGGNDDDEGAIVIIGRILGRLLLLIAVLLLAGGIALAISGGTVTGIAGAVWYQEHSDTLNLSQAVTQRYILPFLWDPIAVTVLNWPVWMAVIAIVAAPGIAGYLLLKLFSRRAA